MRITSYRTIDVEVTQQDIDEGRRCSARHCALARPLARAVSHALGADCWVTISRVGWDLFGPRCTFTELRVPSDASQFIHQYDGYEPVRPSTFQFRVPFTWEEV